MPSHPLLSPSPPAPNSSQHQGLFQWVSSWDGQSIGVSASASVLPMNTQDWSPLGWPGWISLQSKGLSRVLSVIKNKKPYSKVKRERMTWGWLRVHFWWVSQKSEWSEGATAWRGIKDRENSRETIWELGHSFLSMSVGQSDASVVKEQWVRGRETGWGLRALLDTLGLFIGCWKTILVLIVVTAAAMIVTSSVHCY